MMTMFRAVVMLAVLVGLPAAWIYYGPLPTGAQHAVDRLMAAAKEAVGWNKSSDARDRWVRVEELKPAAPRRGDAAVVPVLARLRLVGAIEFALEHWGEGGKLYRFHCEMPVGATQLTQQFEAVAADPQKSVEQVLAEVGSWQLSRQTSGM
jgi:hypothetical protein